MEIIGYLWEACALVVIIAGVVATWKDIRG